MPFLPPAWLLVILIVVRILLLRSLSNVLPMLLERVIPLSLQHLPLVPLPLYSLMTSPLSHCLGISLVFAMLLNTFRYSSLVWALASVRAVFGILSGPGALCLCRFFMILLSSSFVKGMWILFFVLFYKDSDSTSCSGGSGFVVPYVSIYIWWFFGFCFDYYSYIALGFF